MSNNDLAVVTYEFSSASLETKSDLVIGIDFGTTFTGVAFAHSGNISGNDASRIAENVEVIKSWPNPSHAFTEKTPSVIAYNKNPPTWGGRVKPSDDPQVAHFKLGLQPDAGKIYAAGSSRTTASALAFLDPNWSHPKLPQKKAVDFAADYLTGIVNYIKEEFFPKQFGPVFLKNQQISYVVTVPAIWKDSAKALTREAAARAGIPEHKLELITEPEAAALYCATICVEVDLKDGDRFLVCDAGGGTVDLISYEIISRDPFSIEECNVGSGGQCGAMFLNKNFEMLLRRKLGGQATSILTPKRINEAMRFFENNIKRVFNPFDSTCENEFEVPLNNVSDIPDIGLQDGYLKLSEGDIQEVYRPIFDEIHGLIDRQIADVRTKCHAQMKTLFLVGGLGTNRYLAEYLQKKLGSKIDVKQPASGYGAIMRGAVLYRLGLNCVKERLMRRNYGVVHQGKYKPGEHPEYLRTVNKAGMVVCNRAMEWCAYKGRKMANGEVITLTDYCAMFTEDEYNSDNLRRGLTLSCCEEDEPPSWENPHTVIELCELFVDLRPLKPFPRQVGLMGPYYQVDFEVAITFGPELLFKLVYEGRVLGSVTAKYR